MNTWDELKALYIANKIRKEIGEAMKNGATDWGTTIPGVVAGLAQLAKIVGLDIPNQVFDGITAICLFVIGLLSHSGTKV